MTKLRIFLLTVLLILVAVLIVFPYRNKAPIQIAFLGNLTGNGSSRDIAACNGAMLAVDAVNAKGGINGRQLKLSLHDFKGQAEDVSNVCNTMDGKKTSLLIAPFVQEELLVPCMETGRILCTTVGGNGETHPGITTLHFRVKDYGAALADLALSRGTDTMAVFYDGFYSSYGLAYLKGFSDRYLEKGGKIKLELGVDSEGDREDKALSAMVADIHPKGLVVIASADTVGQIGALGRRTVPGIDLYGPPWALTDKLLQAGGDGVNGLAGVLGETAAGWQSGPLESFFKTYEYRYAKRADLSALLGYEVILIMTEGIRNSASPDAFLVRHTLLKLNRFKGLISDYYLNPEDRLKPPFALGEVKEGRISRIE